MTRKLSERSTLAFLRRGNGYEGLIEYRNEDDDTKRIIRRHETSMSHPPRLAQSRPSSQSGVHGPSGTSTSSSGKENEGVSPTILRGKSIV